MNPKTTVATANSRPNRVLVALAAAWLILSLAIGGAVNAGNPPDRGTTAPITGGAAQS